MALSYEGTLFRRIVVSSGFTYGKNMRVSCCHLVTKFSDDYDDTVKRIWKRNSRGYWDFFYRTEVDRRSRMKEAMKYLEKRGVIRVSWNEVVHPTPLTQGIDSFIKLTDNGLLIAPLFLSEYDPNARGCSSEKRYID